MFNDCLANLNFLISFIAQLGSEKAATLLGGFGKTGFHISIQVERRTRLLKKIFSLVPEGLNPDEVLVFLKAIGMNAFLLLFIISLFSWTLTIILIAARLLPSQGVRVLNAIGSE